MIAVITSSNREHVTVPGKCHVCAVHRTPLSPQARFPVAAPYAGLPAAKAIDQ
jgi:hypothetical protein